MVTVELRSVRNFILNTVSDIFPSNKLSIIIGPNGAGKTTLVKVIAGLIKSEGDVLFDGISVNNLAPYERNIGYVPQNNSLFRNMTVYDNIAYGLCVRKLDKELIRRKVKELLKTFKLEGIANKYPSAISGGEARKVALARALAISPKLLILDEPLAGLDAETAELVKQDILMTIARFKSTVILVTHSIRMAFSKAEHLHVMWRGKVLYSGPLRNLINAKLPEDLRFWMGSTLTIDDILKIDNLRYAVVDGNLIPLIDIKDSSAFSSIVIPPEAVKICKIGNLKGKARKVIKAGSYFKAILDLNGSRTLYTITPVPIKPGEVVRLKVFYAFPVW